MNEKFWKITHPMTEEQKQKKLQERSAPPPVESVSPTKVTERSAPPPPDTASVAAPSLVSTTGATGTSPNKYGSGLGVTVILVFE